MTAGFFQRLLERPTGWYAPGQVLGLGTEDEPQKSKGDLLGTVGPDELGQFITPTQCDLPQVAEDELSSTDGHLHKHKAFGANPSVEGAAIEQRQVGGFTTRRIEFVG